MVAHWDENSEDWDTCILGNFQLPGRAKVDVKRGRKLDKKSAKGRNGATITDGGGEGAEVSIELALVDADELDAWAAAMAVLDPTKVAPQAYALVHPQAQLFNIKSVMVEDISAGMPDNGIYTVKIKCAEWFPSPKGKAKSKTTTPTGAKGAANVLDMKRDRDVAASAAAYNKASGGNAGPPPPPSSTGNSPNG